MVKKAKKWGMQYREIPLEVIDEPEIAIRAYIDEEGITDLARSLREIGMIEPLIVGPRGDRFEVIAGHRRYLAAKQAGLFSVPCLVAPGDAKKEAAIKFHENIYRRDLSPLDEARYFYYMLNSLEITQRDLADMLSRSEGYISQRLSVLEWPDVLQHAVEHEGLSFTSARELAAIDDLPTLRYYLEAARRGGCTPRVAQIWKSDYELQKSLKQDTASKAHEVAVASEPQKIMMRCQVCGEVYDLPGLRPLWACPTCLDALHAVKSAPPEG